MRARRLLALERLETRRRTAAARGLARIATAPWRRAVALGLVGAAGLWVVERVEATHGLWRLGVLAAGAWLPMAGPWRFFWRADAALLSRLPIDGATFYRIGALRGVRTAARAALALGFAWAGLAAGAGTGEGVPAESALGAGSWTWLARDAWFLFGTLAAGAAVAPAATCAGGALATSPEAKRVLGVLTGAGPEVAPAAFWLALPPALAGLTVAACAWVEAGGFTPPYVALGGATVAGAALSLAALPLAARTLAESTREVAALDRVLYATVHLDEAKGLEAVWGRIANGPAGRAVYRKDVASMRRRYPAYYLVVGLLVALSLGVTLFGQPPACTRWTFGIALAIFAYTAVLARRLWTPPVEHARLLGTLPLAPRAIARAKASYVVFRLVVPLALVLGAAALRAT